MSGIRVTGNGPKISQPAFVNSWTLKTWFQIFYKLELIIGQSHSPVNNFTFRVNADDMRYSLDAEHFSCHLTLRHPGVFRN